MQGGDASYLFRVRVTALSPECPPPSTRPSSRLPEPARGWHGLAGGDTPVALYLREGQTALLTGRQSNISIVITKVTNPTIDGICNLILTSCTKYATIYLLSCISSQARLPGDLPRPCRCTASPGEGGYASHLPNSCLLAPNQEVTRPAKSLIPATDVSCSGRAHGRIEAPPRPAIPAVCSCSISCLRGVVSWIRLHSGQTRGLAAQRLAAAIIKIARCAEVPPLTHRVCGCRAQRAF